ncbi:hypothetical protein DUNSADRAFT_8404 [Dunaliella salina]|uniref:EF-hand domain-containing protein n=1 Tax=Dunaliella salina TaxID=3046 RepID=A0ABQ7GJQ9_DUNSA|nr:hypothetical protein DUNSADRAFT_8404 [Dunaliella salina]|eukprot:KAF5834820.1 hypothetical protein DUNSADRAFT_8404 [Dunaliella salina]
MTQDGCHICRQSSICVPGPEILGSYPEPGMSHYVHAGSNAHEKPPLDPKTMAEITAAFHRNPQAAAQQLADVLPLDYRIEAILHGKDFDNAYASRLFRAADTDDDGELNELEFQRALELQKQRKSVPSSTPPSSQALRLCFLSASIPFVAFGFLDNAIMLFAGEEIDHAFGLRLGLSTLASAGLGNTMADIIGVSAASGIEAAVRKLPFLRDAPKLTKHQAQTSSARYAKACGAAAGVTLGCLIGLLPLLLQGHFFEDR